MIRKIVFWTHLVCGISTGLLIAVMSFTGAALTFEKDLIAWAERDARRIEAPDAGATRLTLSTIVQRVHSREPDARIQSLAVSSDPQEAIALGLPNNKTLCVSPYSGVVREPSARRMRAFLQTMRSWHTRLDIAGSPGHPSLGARLNGAANIVFVFLGLTGLWIWWPRAWNARVLRPSLWFNPEARGKARDWNWHNVIGFWSLPLLLVLAGTGIVLSYQWAGNLVFRLAGETPPSNTPPAPPPQNAARSAPAPAAPSTTAATLGPDAMLAAVQKQAPDFTLITLRFTPPLVAAPGNQPPPKTFSAIVKTKDQWPPFSTNTLVLDAATGDVKRTDTFATLSSGMKARRWIRLLHSGEALGWFVQLLSGLACVGGCVLVYTGLALSWRRFFSRAATPAATTS